MKKLSVFLVLAMLLSALCIPAAASDTPEGVAVQGTPVIDGTIDAAWADVPAYPIDRLKDGRDTGITSQFRAMWQPEALYVLIEVNDSDHNFNGGPSVGDGMEIYYDLQNLKTAGFEDDFQAYFAMCADDPTGLTYDGSGYGAACLQDAATVAMTTTDAGYVYEAQILMEPLETSLKAGQVIGFDIQVNDQAAGDTERSGAYGWGDDVNNAWQGTMLYGNLTLQGGDGAAASAGGLTEIQAFDYKECGENTNEELQYSHEDPDIKTALSLKPLDGVDPVGTWYDFEIPAAGGDTEFTFLYAANGDRYMDVTFNNETKQVTCPDTGNFQTFDKVSVTFAGVPAGTQTLRIAAPADYTDTHKTPNIDVIWYGAPGASASSAASAGDIVRDGLVAYYDGANNQNGSQDKNAAVWKDCSGNGLDFEVELNDTNYWTDNAFHIDSTRNYLPDELV
ncbi:MAG: hypothetical protein IKQ87_10325, partial [Clostridia bacterium]|nr:hypothetical protein [Clostridia bacterium]